MKITHFKMYPLMIAIAAFLALSGCDGTTGTISDSGLGMETPVPAPVPDAEISTVTANPISISADGTSISTVTVTVNDENADPIANATVTLDQGTGSSIIGSVTNVGDGTYTFNITSTTPETVTYTATADGVVIMQTADVTFTQTPVPPVTTPDAGTSGVTASPVTIAADGSETSTVTVTVNDASSNPITNATVTLDQGAGSSTVGTVTNVGDGTYTFDVTSTTPETVTYTATADSVVITQTADVTFTQTEAQCLAAAGYGTIDINNRTWLDRNLGATEFASAPNDPLAYGDYYQWGRSAEGHQVNTSDTNDTLATSLNSNNVNTDWYGKFIVTDTPPRDWVDGIDTNGTNRSQSWSTPYDSTNNPNQVCPCGYVVPTEQDFINLDITAPGTADTFKLAYAGWRWYDTGDFGGLASAAYFWTSDPNNTGGSISYNLIADTRGQPQRAYGLSIRCIKPQ